MKPNHKEQARYAVASAIDTFRYTTLDAEWSPRFIDLRSWMLRLPRKFGALKTIKSYPGHAVAKKLGIDLEIKHGDWDCTCMGRYSFTYIDPDDIFTRRRIMLRVLNMETWLHELCHAVSSELDMQRFLALQATSNPNLIVETEATLGAASLLTLWQPAGYESELRHCFRCIKDDAKGNKRDLFELCEEVREDVEKQVAFILETENE